MKKLIIPFNQITMEKIESVGGKNASLGEMINNLASLGIDVPAGFAITTEVFHQFMVYNRLKEPIASIFEKLNTHTLEGLSEVSKECKALIMQGNFPDAAKNEITTAYQNLVQETTEADSVAIRSSATAEDSPTASFAGQHDSFLNISGIENVLLAVKKCYASLYNSRAIKYRLDNEFAEDKMGLSVGIQKMVRSDQGCAGVAFTIEPENGNKNLIYITGAWGLGESVVQGAVNVDEFYVFKPAIENNLNGLVYKRLGDKEQRLVYNQGNETTQWISTSPSLRDQFVLTDEEILKLGNWCNIIEKYYEMPMDIEWAKDGITGALYIVQARPETVQARKNAAIIREYTLKTNEKPLLTGRAVGRSIVSGRVSIIKSLADSNKVKQGDIIVADITNPDWNALLRKGICIVTNRGGRTSHASIVARELGVPAVVGTMVATEKLTDGQIITVSCAGGDNGEVYDGKLDWRVREIPLKNVPAIQTKAMLIMADPSKALLFASYPNQGVGLLRMEFIISNSLQIHPMALVKFNELPDNNERKQIEALTRRYIDKKQFFVDVLANSIGLVAAAFYPREVIVRMSDFKTNEYAKLLGGKLFEPEEENPMLGFRGASRYYNVRYREGFGLECEAIKKVRNEMGLTNVKVMIPFCRTVEEGVKVLSTMEAFGLHRGINGLEIYVMAEIPSNILLAKDFAKLFDGFSIGSNDLTQLTLGIERDSAVVSDLFDETNEAILKQIHHLIKTAHEVGVKVGLCGQAPSDHPEFASFLVQYGIDSISFNADALFQGIENIASAERMLHHSFDYSVG